MMLRPLKALILAACMLHAGFAQDAPELVNDQGQQIDTPEKRAAFKTQLELQNVNNTSDANKPVSSATQTALDAKLAVSSATWIDVTKPPYNAKGDGMRYDTGSMTSGSATLNVVGANFPATDADNNGVPDIVGKYVVVENGGVNQLETFTGAGVITGNGALSVTVTATGMAGSPLTLTIPVNTTDNTTAKWVAKVVGRLCITEAFRSLYYVDYTIGEVTGTSFVIKRRAQVANVNDLAITVSAGTATNSSLPITSANTTSGVATPAQLVTQVLARVSTTSLTLAHTAPGTYANATVLIGTNDSAAIQAAIEAARTSPVTRTVFLPPSIGGYLCNLTIYREIKLLGAGSAQHTGRLPSTGELMDKAITPTVLIPAVTSLPVISGEFCFGVSIKDLAICGTQAHTGYGIKLGHWTNNGYYGHGIIFEQVTIAGFETALATRHINSVARGLNINDCVNGFIPGNEAGTGGGSGFDVTNYETTGVERPFYQHPNLLSSIVCKNSAFNYLVGMATVGLSARDRFECINIEDCIGEDVFRVMTDTSALSIDGCLTLRTPGDLIANYGGSDKISVTGVPEAGHRYKTAGQEIPTVLDKGMIVRRFASTDWSVLNETEQARVLFRNPRARDLDWSPLREEWASRMVANTPPYGELAWNWTKFSGAADPSNIGPYNPLNGLLRFEAAASASNAYRFSPSAVTGAYGWSGWPGVGQLYFEQTWVFSNAQAASTVMRLGMFSYSNTLPQSGFGIRLDRSLGTPDANVKFIVVVGGTEYPVDTGVSYTALNPTNSHVMVTMKKVPNGGFTCILRDFWTRVPLAPEVTNTRTLDSSSWGPAAYIGTTGAAGIDLRLDRMTWQQHSPN